MLLQNLSKKINGGDLDPDGNISRGGSRPGSSPQNGEEEAKRPLKLENNTPPGPNRKSLNVNNRITSHIDRLWVEKASL